jgi:hypothetical protein
MKRSTILTLAAVLAGGASVTIATRSAAHHAFAAEFDAAKPVTVQGTISKVRFVNPHSWLYLDVKDRAGNVVNWGFEFGTPNSLKVKGLGKDDVRPGSPIRVEGFRAKNGGAFGYAQTLTLGDGRRVQTGSAPDAPAARR